MSKSIATPFEFLRTRSQDNQSGCFVITDPKDNSVSWKLYLNDYNLSYGTSAVAQKERLNCLWQQFKSEQKVPPLASEGSEYEQLCHWWRSEKLPIPNLQQFLFNLSQETLVQVLAFEQTAIEFFPNNCLNQPLISYSWQDLLEPSQGLIKQWQEVRVYLASPFSRLYLNSQKMYEFYQFWKELNKKTETFKTGKLRTVSLWLQILSQKKCLYEIATEIGIAPLALVEVLLPLLQGKIIQVLPFQEREYSQSSPVMGRDSTQAVQLSEIAIAEKADLILSDLKNSQPVETEKPIALVSDLEQNLPLSASRESAKTRQSLVACIDDSKTVQRQVEIILEAAGYQVLSITDPASTLTILVRQKPVLILLDINMPEIDGYELCQMLHRSRKLKDIPVVMLTGRDGVLDRFRAKLVGATHYLTKPFDPNQLIEVVQRLALKKLPT